MSRAWDPDLPGRPASLKELRELAHQEAVMGAERAFQSPPRGGRRPPRIVSEAERDGVSPTDTSAASPLGVGPSITARSERIARHKQEAGRRKTAPDPRTGRPAGVSTPEHLTGVAPGRGGASPDGH
jgi:hypothetical protein